ncbi:MAG: hypothetical protein ABIE84_01460, partial [bacterium]
MDSWQLITDPAQSGQHNMAQDLKIFNDFEQGNTLSTLRIYSWSPRCISVGYSQSLISQPGWECVKRPTGGGTVFHNEAEVTYSLVTAIDNPLLPKGLIPAYMKISEAVVVALAKIGVKAEISKKKPELGTRNAELCFS